jgi:hypothetical protein
MDVCVCVYSMFVLFCLYIAALRRADPPSKEPYCLCKKYNETEEASAQRGAVDALMNQWMNYRIVSVT